MLIGTDLFETDSVKFLLVSGIRIERKGDYLDLSYGFFKLKVDNKSTWYLTIEQGSVDSDKVKGLCGNYDGNPNSETVFITRLCFIIIIIIKALFINGNHFILQ